MKAKKKDMHMLPIDGSLMEGVIARWLEEQIKLGKREMADIKKRLKRKNISDETRQMLVSDLADSQEYVYAHRLLLPWYLPSKIK